MSLILSSQSRRLIYAGKRSIVAEGKTSRFKIYLPREMNELWKILHEKGIKVNIYLELPDDKPSLLDNE